MMSRTTRLGLAALVLALPVYAGCASPNVVRSLEAENLSLKEERTRLKRDKVELERQLGSYEAQLQAAGTQLDELRNLSQPAYDELTQLGVSIERRGSSLVFSIPSEITFASGQAELSAGGRNAVRAVANRLRSEYPNAIYWIEGHTDSDPIRRSPFKSNRDLSIARAMSVLRYMVESASMPDSQFIVAGFGEYLPVAPNDTAANKARNRRVEIVVNPSQAGR